jgi:hypothetical protein
MQIKAIERKLNPLAGMKLAEIEKCEDGHRRFSKYKTKGFYRCLRSFILQLEGL